MVSLTASNLDQLAAALPVPAYDPSRITPGIVHFGVGAFHRSHQAMYIDRILNSGDSREWGICGVGVLPHDEVMRDVLASQDNLYTLVTKQPDGSASGRVIASIVEYLHAPDDPEAVLARLTDSRTRIVSLTITEGGYHVNDTTGQFEPADPLIRHDLSGDAAPRTVFGFLSEALRRRREAGVPPFTVMSCDNIEGNGRVARIALTSFAQLKNPELATWIAENVAFPNSMVDRITPATTDAGREEVATLYGVEDRWPVLSESFEQWVLEDEFPHGRPAFESVGVQLVHDVEPYELMKLRLLNASHQVMSYLGLLAGRSYVHEICRDPLFAEFLEGYMREEATPTLRPVPGIDIPGYRETLIARFSSVAIQDTLARQVVDASERIPKFLLPVIREQLVSSGELRRSALVIAAWSCFMEGTSETGEALPIQDRRAGALAAAAQREQERPGAFIELVEVFGDLSSKEAFRSAYLAARSELKRVGVLEAVRSVNAATAR